MNLVRTRKQDMLLPGLFFLGDTIALLAAALGTYGLRFGTGWFPVPLGVPPLRVYIWAALASCVTALVVFHERGHYRLLGRGSLRRDLGGVAAGLAVSLALLLSFLFFWRGFSFSRTFVAGYYLLACLLVLGGRRLVRAWQARGAARGRGLLSLALLGESPMTAAVWRLFAGQPDFGYRALGIIDAGEGAPAQIPRLGGSADLERIALEHELDAVVVTLPFTGYPRFVELAERLSAMNVKAFLVPDLEGLLTTRLHHFELEGVPFLAFRHVPLAGLGRVLKRAFDIVASGVGLVLLSPLLGILALAVLADDGRPVLYSQVRLGRDGRRFRIRKFRSMRRDAEADGAGWTVTGDRRRTRLGAWLRRTSLDELPQLWNVLVGEMSLVGPRPERPEFAEGFGQRIPRYFERHRVRSGITGWAQVNGLRGDTPIDERTRYDLFYVENWSLAFDLKILWLTLRSVLGRRGA